VFSVFAAFGVIVWLAYQDNARVPIGDPPLIKASTAPYKLAPDDPGGRQVAEQGEINDLLRDEPGPVQPERVLPLPEEPRAPVVTAARPSVSEPAASSEDAEPPAAPAQAAAQPSTPSAPAGPAVAAQEPAAADATREAEAALARLLEDVGPVEGTAPSSAAAGQAAPPASGSVVAVPAMRPAQPPSTTAPTIVRSDGPSVSTPVDAPSMEADAALARLLAEVAGLPQGSAPSETAPAGAPPRAVAAIAPSGFRIQLAAVRGQDDARRAWADLVERLGPVLADHQPSYKRAETANGVFYRIQLGPFASEQAADRLCVEVQRRNASCFVVAP
jgi:hypothetical protein